MTGVLAVLAALAAALVCAASATASPGPGLYITGAGYGHGVGMSQYGAAGYAEHGYSYHQILQKYYAQTTLGKADPDQIVSVLLEPSGAAAFTGAVKILGSDIKLKPTTNYTVLPAGGKVRLRSHGKVVGTFKAPLQVTGVGPLTLFGTGIYRGSLVFRPSHAGGVMTVNAVPLDAYVQGVVSVEMPSGWPQQALDAQAVAARTYALTERAADSDFDVYDDTRSQVYGGVKAETPTGNAAVAATAGQVVEYDGRPVTTYFFASSGGQTESVQNVFAGNTPEPWLVSEPDPYDDSFGNSHYRWTIDLSLGAAEAKLGKLVDGQLEGIKIVKAGVSPRIVEAQIVGTKGTTTATGTQLRTDFDAPSAWMSFTTVTSQGDKTTSTVEQGTITTQTTTPKPKTSTTKTKTSTTKTKPGKGGNGGSPTSRS
jgi:stage II sporulation protein D